MTFLPFACRKLPGWRLCPQGHPSLSQIAPPQETLSYIILFSLLHASQLVIIMPIYLLLLVCLCLACLHAKKEEPPLPQMMSVSQSSSIKTKGFMTLCCGPCKGVTEGEKRRGRYPNSVFSLQSTEWPRSDRGSATETNR